MMKLYITPGSPYARMARIVVLEKGLESRVEIIVAKHARRTARTTASIHRVASPISSATTASGWKNPQSSARISITSTAIRCPICPAVIHRGRRAVSKPWREACWTAFRSGVARYRPENERSPGIIQHETDRARRMADLWELEIDSPLMHAALNLAQITLACALGLEARNPDFRWRLGARSCANGSP